LEILSNLAYIGLKRKQPEAQTMSINTPAPVATAPAASQSQFRLFAMIRKAFAAISEGIEQATRYRILANLSNEELTALGITRKDIPRIAVNGWKR
jgi:uncharacterized protein YjiS (DUF1127 family)